MASSIRKTVGLLTLVLVLVLTGTACADLYWEALQETSGGATGSSQTVKTFYSQTASRVESGNSVMIIDYGRMISYQLDPTKKTYSEVDLNKLAEGPPGQGREAGDKGKMFQQMMKNMMDSIEVTPVDEQKQIAGYDCRRVNVKMMMVESEYWVSKDVPGYQELKRISGQVADKLKGNPMLAQMTQAGMLNKLDGFPVQVVTHAQQRTVTTTLQKIEEKSLSSDLFQVPSGYTQVEHPSRGGVKRQP